MNILELKQYDVANGPGIRASIWVSGCSNKCEGCWSKHTWNPNQGTPYKEISSKIDELISNPNIDGISILGGDPFYWVINTPDYEFLQLLNKIKSYKKDLTIWVWTGYTLEELKQNTYAKECLEYIDVLIDGKFEQDKKDLTLKYRGSSNQRVLYLK